MRSAPALTGSASWSKRLVDMLIKRAVMEGILRQAPRLSRPPAAEAGPLQVGWASCGCRAGPRIHAGSTQASRGSVGMVSPGCGIWARVWALVCFGCGSACGCGCGFGPWSCCCPPVLRLRACDGDEGGGVNGCKLSTATM